MVERFPRYLAVIEEIGSRRETSRSDAQVGFELRRGTIKTTQLTRQGRILNARTFISEGYFS